MLDQHRSHLVSTCETVAQHLGEVRQVVTSGKSPTGGLVRPLPEPVRARLLAKLDELAARVDELHRSFAPSSRRPTDQADEPGAARMWVSILLRTIEGLMRDLLPERMGRQYGHLEPAQAANLEADVNEILALVREAIRAGE